MSTVQGMHREAAAENAGLGDPVDSAPDDAGASWHVHTGTLLPGTALGPADWFLSLDVSAPDSRFPAPPPVARTTCAPEAPLRPPRQPS
jgi:hypothetical protein